MGFILRPNRALLRSCKSLSSGPLVRTDQSRDFGPRLESWDGLSEQVPWDERLRGSPPQVERFEKTPLLIPREDRDE